MATVKEGLYYSESHEYVKVESNVGYIGITDYAQHALGNVVYVDLPDVDDEPELLNKDPWENWIIKVELSDKSELDALMDAKAYEAFCENA